jgi:hypothetical protein
MDNLIEVLTAMDSAMLTIAVGGLLGLACQRIIGRFFKPNYYDYAKPSARANP